MELTIEQALKQGVAAHKEGNLQEAERLYRAIIQSQPAHPDANHNLGLIAVSVNKAGEALPLFKTALDANPKIEQFWFSYIDALIKYQRVEDAKQVIERAKTQGVTGEKLNALEAQVVSTNEEANVSRLTPSQQQINNLLAHYQSGRLDEAETLAKSLTQEFPEHQFAWKVLGAVLGQKGRKSEAAEANRRAVKLLPEDSAAHSNLGNTLKELGRLDEAEASYKQAITLKPDFAEAHSNLGNTLIELGRLDEAEASYKQAIALNPDYAEAHSNLGNTLKELGRLDESEASLTQAIVLKPDYAEAHYNLGITLKELERFDEAVASYKKAIALKSDYALAYYGLGKVLYVKGNEDSALENLAKANSIEPNEKEYELLLLVIKARKAHKANDTAKNYKRKRTEFTKLMPSPLILNRDVEADLIASLYEMNSVQLSKTKRDVLLASGKDDARYGNGKVSPDFCLFEDSSPVIQKFALDLTKIIRGALKSDIYIYSSFFNILGAGGGLTPHCHLSEVDKDIRLGLEKQKYSLVYYLAVGDQECSEPGILRLYEPNEEILPRNGMVVIFPANRMHSAIYGGKIDRVMIGVNFYSL